ncbi:MAG: putative multidrug export ATP-binding/permease protein, partial [Mucilaginibacter sp.]|nr:putative multidrug export ATP-binding/permease protein [Mucilaginibacter sp.]
MKTYFRLLSFAKPIEKFAIPYIVFTLLYVLFSTLVLALLGPLLNTLFSTDAHTASTVVQTGAAPSIFHLKDLFNYYLQYYISNYGAWGALKFVCGVIIVSVFLGNLFRYLSQRTMENLRVHTLLNFRKTVFNNVMDMHLGFFNNERKGDIISKIASDVQVVQFSVTGTLQVIFKEPVQLIAFLVT